MKPWYMGTMVKDFRQLFAEPCLHFLPGHLPIKLTWISSAKSCGDVNHVHFRPYENQSAGTLSKSHCLHLGMRPVKRALQHSPVIYMNCIIACVQAEKQWRLACNLAPGAVGRLPATALEAKSSVQGALQVTCTHARPDPASV